MFHIISSRKLRRILDNNVEETVSFASDCIRKWLLTGNENELSTWFPNLLKTLQGLNVLEAHKSYREALENRILCLCLKYGKDVTFKDERDDYSVPNPVEMTYENAIVFSERKTLGNYNVAGVCYSLKNDKEWDKHQGPHGPQLENGRHPGLEFIVSAKWLAGDEAESLCVFKTDELERLIKWIKEECVK